MTQHGFFHLGGFSIEVNLAILMTLLGIAACFDIKSRRIPNWLVVTGLVFSLGTHISLGNGGFAAWALGLLVGFGLFLPLYVVRAMGAGDVKLMGMVGSFLGPASAAGTVLTTLVAGGALAIAVALWRGALRHTLANVRSLTIQAMFNTFHGGSVQIEALPASAGNLPYAVAIAAGTFIYLLIARSGHALFA